MRARLQSADLRRAIEFVSCAAKGLSSRETALASLQPRNGGLLVACHAGHARIERWLPCDHSEGNPQLAIGAELKPLKLALDGGAGSVTIETIPSANLMEMAFENGYATRLRLCNVPTPIPPSWEQAVWHDIPLRVLADLSKAARLVSDEKFRPEFRQWVLTLGDEGVRSIGGDGGLFEVRTWESNVEAHSTLTATIGHSCIQPMVALIDRLRREHPTDAAQLADDGERVFVRVGDTVAYFGRDERHPYPDASRFTNRVSNFRCVVAVADLRAAVKRIEIGESYKDAKRVNWSYPTWIDLDPKVARLWDKDRSDEATSVPVVAATALVESDWPQVAVTTASLISICKTATPFDYIQIEAIDNAAPLVLRLSHEPAVVDVARVRHDAGGHMTVTMLAGVQKPRVSVPARFQPMRPDGGDQA